jgi:hypothetical protein
METEVTSNYQKKEVSRLFFTPLKKILDLIEMKRHQPLEHTIIS